MAEVLGSNLVKVETFEDSRIPHRLLSEAPKLTSEYNLNNES